MRIFIHRRGLDHGPYSLEKVQKFLSNKQLSPEDFAWSSALGRSNSWLSLEQLLSELKKIDSDCLNDVTDVIVELPKQLQKIKGLLEKDEAEHGHIYSALAPLGLAMLENLMVLNHLGLRKRFLGMLKSLLD